MPQYADRWDTDRVTDARMEELQSAAVAALEEGESVLRAAVLSEHEEDGWSADFAEEVADGMAACLWFVRLGFRPPGNFGYWLFRIKEGQISMQSSHRDLDKAIDDASGALYYLDKEWERRSDERTGERESSD